MNNVVLVSSVQQTHLVIHMYIIHIYIYSFIFRFFSHIGYHRIFEFPVLYSRSLLVIYFIYSSVYILFYLFIFSVCILISSS